MLDTTEAVVQSTSTLASSNPGCSLEAVPETSLIESIAPLPKARPRKIRHRKRVSSAIITRTHVKTKLFPQQSEDSSTDEEEVFANSESNSSLSDGDFNLAPQTDKLVILKCGDFVIANVHTAAEKCKKFIGKLVSGPDKNEDFEISFLERSRKIKNRFVFPEIEDLASIGKKDMPPPHAAAQTKRLYGVMKFNVNLLYV